VTDAGTSAVVTGAAGWLGQNLVRALVPSGRRLRCLVRTPEEGATLEVVSPSVEAVVGDVRDPSVVDTLFAGMGEASVFHAAAVIHPAGRVRELFDVNVGGTQLVLDRAKRAGAGRFVHVSSNSPFGANPSREHRFTEDSPYNPYLGYGRSKMEAEQLVLAYHERGDVSATIVRAPWFYGPFQPERQTRFIAAVRRGRFPVVGDGSARRSMAYTGNLVQGLLKAEVADAAPGRAYWIADPEPYAVREVVETVRRAAADEGLQVSGGSPSIPEPLARLAAGLDAVLQGRGRYVQPLHVLGELKDTIACDVTRAREELGYAPEVTLYEGMRASIRWALDRGEPV
jgi:nucleoside-diphosphate-sugar epimerase